MPTLMEKIDALVKAHKVRVMTIDDLKTEQEIRSQELAEKFNIRVDEIADAIKDRRLDAHNPEVENWLMADSMIQIAEEEDMACECGTDHDPADATAHNLAMQRHFPVNHYIVRKNCEYSISVEASDEEQAAIAANDIPDSEWDKAWSQSEAELCKVEKPVQRMRCPNSSCGHTLMVAEGPNHEHCPVCCPGSPTDG